MCFSVVARDQGLNPLPVKKGDAVTALHHRHHRDQEAVLHDQTAAQGLGQEAQALDQDPDRTPSHVQDQDLLNDQGKRGLVWCCDRIQPIHSFINFVSILVCLLLVCFNLEGPRQKVKSCF